MRFKLLYFGEILINPKKRSQHISDIRMQFHPQLKKLLESKQYTVSPYNKFKVYEPKERVIEAGSFKDKIVQHCICDNILLPILESEFIPSNVAGQNGK